jgi:eukaryotic translation initiation factor 2C
VTGVEDEGVISWTKLGRGGGRGGGISFRAPSMKLEKKERLVPGDEGTEEVKIVIRPTSVIRFADLIRFSQGRGPENEQVLQATMCLQVALRHVPSMLYTPVGTNFFTPEDRYLPTNEARACLEDSKSGEVITNR